MPTRGTSVDVRTGSHGSQCACSSPRESHDGLRTRVAGLRLRDVSVQELMESHSVKNKPAARRSTQHSSPPGGLGKAFQGLAGDSSLYAAYSKEIDDRLAQLFGSSRDLMSPRDVFVRMRGAFPALVREHLAAAGWEKRLGHESSDTISHWNEYPPELHPLDFEWYFTPDCADYLADAVCGRGKTTLCLGVPTVAAAAIRKGRNVVVLDRNPLIVRRFPALLRSSQLWLLDIADCEQHLARADVVLFDAPWYLEDTYSWLAVAMRAAKAGGLIAFCLFPRLVRPTASAEREAILEAAESAGKVEVLEDAIAYETPIFESEALYGAGITGFGNWRRADLVLVQRTTAVPRRMSAVRPSRPSSTWLTYLLGRRVVKVRYSPARTAVRGGSVRPLPGSVDFVYPSVSARDPRRRSIDLWTSRNRVAQVGNLESVMGILQLLENGGCLGTAIRSVYRASSASGRREIEHAFRRLLG